MIDSGKARTLLVFHDVCMARCLGKDSHILELIHGVD